MARILTAADIPGRNAFGIYPDLKDQPVLAAGQVRHKGEPVLALVGTAEAVAAVRDAELPIRWEPLPALHGLDAATAPGAPAVHEAFPDNVLVRGRVVRGDVEAALAGSAVTASYALETSFVEHAYIEPEAGYAVRRGETIELFATTQAPYMDRETVAEVLGVAPEQVRIVPSACGGGFGGKLDVSVQPILAVAAWLTGRPVRTAWTRPESMAASTKRHPARIEATCGADADGRLTGFRFHGDFNTGAYASWGPTVASRVPVHATGPYHVRAAACTTRAIYTNDTPAGAFRGFGVPQSAIVHEALMDMLAERQGSDRLDFRLRNALRPGDVTHCGQVLETSVGLVPCLEALRPHWQSASCARGLERLVRHPAPRAGCRLHVVRPRQHLDVEPLEHGGDARPPAASRCSTVPSTSARAAPRSWSRSVPRPWACRSVRSLRWWATPHARSTPARPRPRGRPWSRATPRGSPASTCADSFSAAPTPVRMRHSP